VQFVFQYDYSAYRDAYKRAKKLRGDMAYVWIIQHPVTRRFKVIQGETAEDRPTRVPVEWEHYAEPPKPYEPDDGELWRMLVGLIDGGHIVISLKDYGVINSTDLADIVRNEASNV